MIIISDPIICRCEEIYLSQVNKALAEGAKTTKELKLKTRVGMGMCQGKTCRPLLEKLVATYKNENIPATPHLTHQFPIRPITLATLKNKSENLL